MLLPEVLAALFDLLEGSLHIDFIDTFVFDTYVDKPRYDSKFLLDGLRSKLDAMNIRWHERNIVFHSRRHFSQRAWRVLS